MKRGEPKFFALKDRMRDGETDKEMNRDGQIENAFLNNFIAATVTQVVLR